MGISINARDHTKESYLTPYFKIYLGGKPLSDFEHTLVEEVSYEDTSTGSDLVSVTIHDPDYILIGDKRLIKNTRCKVEAGYTKNYSTWVDGFLSAVDVEFPEIGLPSVTLHIMDKSYVMNRVERQKGYKNLSYCDIASSVAKRHGLSFEGDRSGKGGKKQESVTQSFETDIQFLMGLASEIGYLVFVKENKLYFKDVETYKKAKSVGSLWYRRHPFDLINFRPRIIQADQLDEMEENDIDDKNKKTTSAKVVKK